ncbi:hypothetical protein KC207_14240 [Phycicoccus sp. BSK3Z-2]|uniref:Uncharacterized protein n=1 Tax=Phycicoccus avicenniae TaxID=2828860 RepID=A0A941DAB9_9MICO|nr:hypothetical protein [Phycicoccus avicenniae]MBR7744451.1 hypothetical protein [Phycicoccus avicenniae]
MTWTRIGDDWPDRPAVLDLSRSARLLLLELTVYCNRHTTDGRIPEAAIPRNTDAEDWRGDLEQLAAAGLAEQVDERAWQVDWSDQESAEQVRARKDFNAAKQKRYRDRKARHERGDHSECDPRFCKAVTRNATRNGDGDVTSLVTPSRPDPSRPLGRDREQGAETGSAGAPPTRPTGAGSLCPHGVPNGIYRGQCPHEDCTEEWQNLQSCASGSCHAQQVLGVDACTGKACWLRDEWPQEREAS